jgi:hypothetical protein
MQMTILQREITKLIKKYTTEITKLPSVCDLSYRHPLKYPTGFYVYSVRYLSHRWYHSRCFLMNLVKTNLVKTLWASNLGRPKSLI